MAGGRHRHGRALTAGECAMVAGLFGTAIDPAVVRVYCCKWWVGQPASVTMAPDGHLWFHPQGELYCTDFAAAPIWTQAHFIHEMAHVWQHQQGVKLWLKRLPFARYRYLPLAPGKPFHRYGIEQQAEIIRDYWLLRRGIRLDGRPPLDSYVDLIPFAENLPPTRCVA